MRVAIGADDRGPLTDALTEALEARGHQLARFGVLAGGPAAWASIGRDVGCEQGRGRASSAVRGRGDGRGSEALE